MTAANPYHPPSTPASDAVPNSRHRFFSSIAPATLAVGLTLLLWIVLVSTLDGLLGHRFAMLPWSLTLVLSCSVSILAINRVWRAAVQPLAYGAAFSVFSIVYVLAEGDTSNGTDLGLMTIVYGTLLALPGVAFFIARRTTRIPRDS